MVLTTALDAKFPTVKCGYLNLNQADRAPGYEPPTAIHGIFAFTPCFCYFLIE
jgi:hypothetical protein